MADQNILNGGLEVLEQIISDVTEYNDNREALDELNESIKLLSREVNTAEKNIQTEVTSRVKEGSASINASYDKLVVARKNKLKKAQSKRDQAKMAGVKERIAAETQDLKTENRELKRQIEKAFAQEKISLFCNSRLFLALFNSITLLDYVIFIACVAIVFGLIPFGIYISPVIDDIFLILYTFVAALVVILIYKKVNSGIMVNHRELITQAQEVKSLIKSNEIKIEKIRHSIKRDKNEEMYGLESYDERIEAINNEIMRIESEREAACDEFEQKTKTNIISEIEGRYTGKIEENKNLLAAKKKEREVLEQKLTDQKMFISNNYESYLGREFIDSEDRLFDLAEMMQEYAFDTIGQAISEFKELK